MKAIIRIGISAAMAVMLLTVALVDTGSAKTKIRFNGFLQGMEVDVSPDMGKTLVVDGSADGLATDLGQFSMKYDVTVNLGTGRGIGTAQFIADSGDTISATLFGQGDRQTHPVSTVSWRSILSPAGQASSSAPPALSSSSAWSSWRPASLRVR